MSPSFVVRPVSASDLPGTALRGPRLQGKLWTPDTGDHLPLDDRLLIGAFCATRRHPEWHVGPLVRQGARVDARDDWGRTALHLAAHEDRLNVLCELLDLGADVNAETHDPMRWTPLHGALAREAWSCVDVLVAAGADLNRLESAHRRAPLIHVAGRSNDLAERVAEWLERGADPCVADDEGEIPLHLAAAAGTLDNVRRLIAAGSPVDTASHAGTTPLLKAVDHGREDVVRALLDAGANPFARSHHGATARQRAVLDKELGILGLLDEAEVRWVQQEQAALRAVFPTASHAPSPRVPVRSRL